MMIGRESSTACHDNGNVSPVPHYATTVGLLHSYAQSACVYERMYIYVVDRGTAMGSTINPKEKWWKMQENDKKTHFCMNLDKTTKPKRL